MVAVPWIRNLWSSFTPSNDWGEPAIFSFPQRRATGLLASPKFRTLRDEGGRYAPNQTWSHPSGSNRRPPPVAPVGALPSELRWLLAPPTLSAAKSWAGGERMAG